MKKGKTINAEAAFALIFNLFKTHPWLNSPGTMSPEDALAEQEAVAFLLAGNLSNKWSGCSEPAQRVVNTLLLDFMAKLRTPGASISRDSWVVPKGASKDEQALALIAAEIYRSHPHLKLRH